MNSKIDLDTFLLPGKNVKGIQSTLSELIGEDLPLFDGNKEPTDRMIGQKRRRESLSDIMSYKRRKPSKSGSANNLNQF